ncbi:MAG: T9SS C-terminal target domain-containing protein [Calditrichaeota bacterium]|nr:MAG: T9SS C-terminal target domain-containing protein [Calditrichota bacterium]
MKMGSRFILISLILMLYSGIVLAQDFSLSVTVTPQKAVIEPGAGLQFEAHLFTANGNSVNDFDDFTWRVKPDSLAKINQDGYLQAGREPGMVVVIATMKRGGILYYGEAKVEIGKPQPPRIKVLVTPLNAYVQPDSTKKFHVVAVDANNRNFKIEHIRWQVNPAGLGKISQDGLFKAGSRTGQGQVVALVDIGGAVYRGHSEVTVTLPPTGSIAGNVTDDLSGAALANAQIVVHRLGHIHWMKAAMTDENGDYVVEKLIPGLYVVKANARDYLPEFYENASHLAEALPVQVDENSAVSPIDFQLGHGATINGAVLSDDSTTVLPGSLIAAIRKTTNTKRFAVADSIGEYSLRSLPQGAYAVLATSSGYYPEYFDDAQNLVDATLLSINPPDTTNGIDFYLATATAISGEVLAAEDGSPLPGAAIQIYQKISTDARWKYFRSTFTDREGKYIVGLPAGVYFVRANARGFSGEYFDDTPNAAEATEVVVIENQHTTDVSFKLARLGTIAGFVFDADNKEPVAEAVVSAFMEINPQNRDAVSAFDRRHFKTQADSSGAYRFEALPVGKYYVEAIARGYLAEFWQEVPTLADATPLLVEVGNNIEGIDFTLSHGAAIAGNVSDAADSSGLAGAAVTVWSRTSGVKRHVFANRDGDYKVSGLPAGDYYAYASLKGYDGKFYDGVDDFASATIISLPDNGTAEGIDFYLPKFATHLGTIAGVVTEEADSLTDAAPTPIAGAFVIAVPTTSGPAHFDVTDPFGNYRITRLLKGRYIVFSWAPGHAGEFFDNVQNWQQATRIPIEENSEIEGINFALAETDRGPYHIRGRIHSGEGQNRRQIANAIVFAIGAKGMAAAITDEDGRFAIGELPAGDYKIRVEGAGIQSSYLGGTNETDAETVALENGIALDIGDMAVEAAVTSVGSTEEAIPAVFGLEQNYPNPFNPETTVKFTLAQSDDAVVQIFNVLGQHVRTLVDEKLDAGTHTMQWNGADNFGNKVASGIYLMRLTSSEQSATIRMILLK